MSERLGLGILLAISGGLMDAYSYLFRDGVFANAQTGNILLLSVNLSRFNFGEVITYIFPISAFATGVAMGVFMRRRSDGKFGLHWRQVGILIEAIILFAVAFIPSEFNLIANSLISLACGFQVESFRKIEDNSIATTMCIGNMRSAIYSFGEYKFTGDNEKKRSAFVYATVIFFFCIGAVLGSVLIDLIGTYAILGSSAILFACFGLMYGREKVTV